MSLYVATVTEDAGEGTPRGEDERRVAAVLKRLNHDFYSADPDGYFHARWLSLVLLGAKPNETLALFREGVTHGHVHVRLDDPQTDPTGVRDFVTMESQVLLHQTCETLLRLFLAHVGRPACPWLEVAGETRFADFKKRVRADILDSQIEDSVDDVFLGGPTTTSAGGPDARASGLANLCLFLRTFARRWLDEAHAYNSLKHGLAVFPSAVGLSFVAEAPGVDAATLGQEASQPGAAVPGVVLGHGPSLDFLESTPEEKGRSWARTTVWVDVDQSLALIEVARFMIQCMWGIARMRYTDAAGPTSVFLPTDLTPESLRSTNRSAAHRWSMPLDLYEPRPRKPKA